MLSSGNRTSLLARVAGPWPATLVVAMAAAIATGMFSGVRTSAQSRLVPLPTVVPAPADNPSTPERVALGRLLFWDPILSGPRDAACATCHHPDFAYADGRDLAIGANGVGLGASRTFMPGHPVRFVKRNSQTVLNVGFNGLTERASLAPEQAPMFWDLRTAGLEAQALEPIKAADEMRGASGTEAEAVGIVVTRLRANAEYARLFAAAFGGRDAVSSDNLARALAAFQRSLVATDAPFDRYLRGDTSAMTPLQLRGMNRFQSAGCINCHSGPMLSDFAPHVLGVPLNPKLTPADTGVNQTHAFRTASLRNLSETGPYMHNGVFATLEEVVAFYQRVSGGRGGRRGGQAPGLSVPRDQVDPLARQLNMRGRGQGDIVAFLRALDAPTFDRTVPPRVPSGLPVGGRLRP